jgi:Tfp pilus assembly protein PilF
VGALPREPVPLPEARTERPPQRAQNARRESGLPAPRPPAPLPVTRAESAAPEVPPRAPAEANDLELALYYHRAGDFENALQHYRALLQRNELNAQAHNNLGLLYQEKKLLAESARELARAVLIEPGNVLAHNNYGVTLLLQGRADEAAAQFRSALKLDPRNVDALVNLALAQRDARQPEVAKEMLLEALTISPRSAAAHYNLAQLYDQTSEAARAIDHYRKFLEYAGTEYASRAAAVRARIEALSRIPE